MKIPAEELKEYVQKHPHHRLKKIADHFGSSIPGVCKAFHRTGIIRKQPLEGILKKIDAEALKSYIHNNPNHLLKTIAHHFGVSIAAVSLACKRLGIERKKL